MEQSNIPHILHYIWLGGGSQNYILRNCIETFSKAGENRIVKWDEHNMPNPTENIKILMQEKAWAFVSDWIRLKVLYEYGGLYVDTDVQFCKPIPQKLYERDIVLSYACDDMVSTAFIMAKPHHTFIKLMLEKTEALPKGKQVVNNHIIMDAIFEAYPNFPLNGRYEEFAPNCVIYPRYFFETATFRKNAGYAIHHGFGTWKQNSFIRKTLRPIFKFLRYYCKPFGVIYQQIVNKRMMDHSGPLLDKYHAAIKA